MKKKLLWYTIGGIVFVSVLGTLSHFLYEWTGKNIAVGLFTPVSESIWEHIKLLFFPMVLYTLFLDGRLKQDYPCILPGMLSGVLLGSLLIPVLYYTYSGTLGYSSTWIDIAIFYISVLAAFWQGYRRTLHCPGRSQKLMILSVAALLAVLFLLFTYSPPSIALFIQE